MTTAGEPVEADRAAWSSPASRAFLRGSRLRPRLAMAGSWLARPVPASLTAAAVLHLLWWWLVANSGGDLAAQDAWAEFARVHPHSAYNLAWYGGVHPASYSLLSPYIMAALGVRTTMMVVGTVSAGVLALVLVRTQALRRPLWPALYGAFALAGNAVSGRVTFGLGLMFGLGAVAIVFGWPRRWRGGRRTHTWPRACLAGGLSALATASSPVAGLFLGIVAAALFLSQRRPAAYVLGLPPVAVVALTAWLFPFDGEQPMGFWSLILPVVCGVCCFVLAPASWRTVRIGSAVYVVAAVAAWLIPSQVGTNVARLGLVFGGVVLIAIAVRSRPRQRPDRPTPARRLTRVTRPMLALAIVTASCWQVGVAVRDAVSTRPTTAWTVELQPLLHQLRIRDADQGRVEVVPASSHREASALAPYVNLARGWNRQADAERNPIFYDDDLLTPTSYRQWLDRWAVRYVVLPAGPPDDAAVAESALVARGVGYLKKVWSDPSWRLYRVVSPTPLADPPAVVKRFDATELVLRMPSPGTVVVRIPDSPWLSLVDEKGRVLEAPESTTPGTTPVNVHGCLGQQHVTMSSGQVDDGWTLLEAPAPGTYRIAAPYAFPRGTACPDDLDG